MNQTRAISVAGIVSLFNGFNKTRVPGLSPFGIPPLTILYDFARLLS